MQKLPFPVNTIEVIYYYGAGGTPMNPSGLHLNDGRFETWFLINGTHYIKVIDPRRHLSKDKFNKDLYAALELLGADLENIEVKDE